MAVDEGGGGEVGEADEEEDVGVGVGNAGGENEGEGAEGDDNADGDVEAGAVEPGIGEEVDAAESGHYDGDLVGVDGVGDDEEGDCQGLGDGELGGEVFEGVFGRHPSLPHHPFQPKSGRESDAALEHDNYGRGFAGQEEGEDGRDDKSDAVTDEKGCPSGRTGADFIKCLSETPGYIVHYSLLN